MEDTTVYVKYKSNTFSNNLESYKNEKKKLIVIGIGGISRSGKSTLRKTLKNKLNPTAIFHIDEYIISPIKKWDNKIQSEIMDWEDPKCLDLDKFYRDFKNSKEKILNNSKSDYTGETEYIIAEGFLLYFRKDITDLIDIKFSFNIDKELCRERRRNTKDFPSDHYFDEYIWKGYHQNK